MTNLIIKIFLGCYNEILIDNAYVYNMRNHALSQEKICSGKRRMSNL